MATEQSFGIYSTSVNWQRLSLPISSSAFAFAIRVENVESFTWFLSRILIRRKWESGKASQPQSIWLELNDSTPNPIIFYISDFPFSETSYLEFRKIESIRYSAKYTISLSEFI